MVHIISKSDGPYKEDVAAKRFIQDNSSKIHALANHLTAGRWQDIRQNRDPLKKMAERQGPASRPERRKSDPATAQPYLRISPNNRVVVVDAETATQLHFLGEMRWIDGFTRFYLATEANGLSGLLDDSIMRRLEHFDRVELCAAYTEHQFSHDVSKCLGLVEFAGEPD